MKEEEIRGLFKKGFEASREEKERQDRARENMGKKLFRFFLGAPEKGKSSTEAEIRFLTEEPINFYEHTIKGVHNGKEVYDSYTCTGEDCPFCKDGDRPTYKGAFLVVDRTEFEYTDKDGKKKTGKDRVKLFVQGMRVVSQLDRISERYGLSNRDVTLVRLGKGTDTTYTIEKGDKDELTSKEVENLLPDKLREEYDGTMESLYSMIEEQLMMCTKDYVPDDEDEEEEDEDDSAVIGVEEEEEKPAPKKKLGKKKAMFKSTSRSENSLKPKSIGNERAKKLMRSK